MSNRLDEIALLHGTDKSSACHNYTESYYAQFASLSEQKVTLLEIGVLGGASLRMWADFFPFARLFGIDRDPTARQHESERARVFIGDQLDVEFLRRVAEEAGEFDIIIDDGGHHPDQVLTSLRFLFPYLKEGGSYVIEDVATSFSPRYGSDAGLYNPASAVEYLKGLLDVIFGHPDYGGVIGDEISSRICSLRFDRNIAFLTKGRPDDRRPRLAERDLRMRRRAPDHPLEQLRARSRRLLHRLRRNGARILRDLLRIGR